MRTATRATHAASHARSGSDTIMHSVLVPDLIRGTVAASVSQPVPVLRLVPGLIRGNAASFVFQPILIPDLVRNTIPGRIP
jgi:hypothetical protein